MADESIEDEGVPDPPPAGRAPSNLAPSSSVDSSIPSESGLARFKRSTREGVEHLTWYWVLGPGGAVSTWFSDTKAIIGRSVCSGAAWHAPAPWGDAELHGPCEFLESDCWTDFGSMLFLDPVVEAFDRGDDEAIYRWLERHYSELRRD